EVEHLRAAEQPCALIRYVAEQRVRFRIAGNGRGEVIVPREREVAERDERPCPLDGGQIRRAAQYLGNASARDVAIAQQQLDAQQTAQRLEQRGVVAERLER